MADHPVWLSLSVFVSAHFRQSDVEVTVIEEEIDHGWSADEDDLKAAVLRLQRAMTIIEADTAGRVTAVPDELWSRVVALADPHIRRVVGGSACPSSELDDCVQEVWAQIVSRILRVDAAPPAGSFAGWLHAVARRTALRFSPHRGRTARVQTLPMVSAADLPDTHESDPASNYAAREAARDLASAVGLLRANVGEQADQLVQYYLAEPSSLTRVSHHFDLTAGRFWHLWRKTKAFLRMYLEPPD